MLLEQTIRAIHTLSWAAWFGALAYRVCFVDPKANRSLGAAAEFEKFSLDLAHGMRYVVTFALAACGLSGFTLMGLRSNSSELWQTMMVAKIGLWLVAISLFSYISWVYWPRRVFANSAEWPALRRQGLILSIAMIAIAGLGFLLGQLAPAVGQAQEFTLAHR